MTSARFHELRDRAAAVNDAAFAESVRHSPMRAGRTDTDRVQHVFEAILRTDQDQPRSPTGARGSTSKEWNMRVSAGPAQLHVNLATYQGPAFQKDDKICAISRRGEPLYMVQLVDDRDHSRLIVHLIEAS